MMIFERVTPCDDGLPKLDRNVFRGFDNVRTLHLFDLRTVNISGDAFRDLTSVEPAEVIGWHSNTSIVDGAFCNMTKTLSTVKLYLITTASDDERVNILDLIRCYKR